MANPSIDDGTSYEFITLRGRRMDQALQIEAMQRPGIDGVHARKMGQSARPSRFVGIVDVDSDAEADTRIKAMRGLRGKAVTLTDDGMVAQDNVLVMDVENILNKTVVNCVGGLGTTSTRRYLEFTFDLLFTETS